MDITRYAIRNEQLMPWVKFFWHIENADADIHYKLLPTDCIDVILNLGDDMIYETESDKIVAPSFHINGLRSKYSFIHQENKINIFGISFYPFGLYPFVRKPLQKLQDKIVSMDDLSPVLACKLKKAVTMDTAEEIINAFEKTLLEELSHDSVLIENAKLISDFMHMDSSISIKSFCNDHVVNIKTFERMFLSITGYTPKVLKNLKRFQNTSNQLAHQDKTSLIDIAYDNSFTDQSHFIKDFSRFSGSVPHTFKSERATVKENVKYTIR